MAPDGETQTAKWTSRHTTVLVAVVLGILLPPLFSSLAFATGAYVAFKSPMSRWVGWLLATAAVMFLAFAALTAPSLGVLVGWR